MVILKVVLTVIFTFFFSIGFDRIVRFLKKCLLEKVEKAIGPIQDKTIHSLKIFVRSYFLSFLMTFAELSIGFPILRIPWNAVVRKYRIVCVAVSECAPYSRCKLDIFID